MSERYVTTDELKMMLRQIAHGIKKGKLEWEPTLIRIEAELVRRLNAEDPIARADRVLRTYCDLKPASGA